MTWEWVQDWYYAWAVLLVVLAIASWALNLLTLPGNWLIVLEAGLFAFLFRPGAHEGSTDSPLPGVHWITVVLLFLLAGLGELLEFAGAAGSVKEGGSKRGAALAMILSMAGAMVGAGVGIPIPIIGSIVGAVLFACLGALVGAMIGEAWKGKKLDASFKVGQAAFWGRLLGTVAKVTVGSAMVALLATDAFFFR
jgi:hypothetical protein